MKDLTITRGAVFSEDRKYRYALTRTFYINKPSVMFIGLNPSTANEISDDNTIRRVIRFAHDWGFGAVHMMNLFGLVTPNPDDLKKCPDPVGENDKWLMEAHGKCNEVIFAWGSFPEATERAKKVIEMFPSAKALIINRDGTPRHPLYVPATTKRVPFKYNLMVANLNKPILSAKKWE